MQGIMIDETLQTSNDNVFAIGDVTALNIKSAYIAEHFAIIAVKNALLNKRLKVLRVSIHPRCVGAN